MVRFRRLTHDDSLRRTPCQIHHILSFSSFHSHFSTNHPVPDHINLSPGKHLFTRLNAKTYHIHHVLIRNRLNIAYKYVYIYVISFIEQQSHTKSSARNPPPPWHNMQNKS